MMTGSILIDVLIGVAALIWLVFEIRSEIQNATQYLEEYDD